MPTQSIPGHISTHWDDIPNFGQQATLESVRDGLWHSPSTWRGMRVPTADDILAIHHDVYAHTSVSVHTIAIYAFGRLFIEASQPITLTLATLFIAPRGLVRIGSATNPITRDNAVTIQIRDVVPTDPGQYGTGIICLDGSLHLHGKAPLYPWLRLAEDVQSGDSVLLVKEDVSEWLPGDVLVCPDSRQWDDAIVQRGEYQYELWRVASTAAEVTGTIVDIAAAALYAHTGTPSRKAIGGKFLPHVANLTRPITIASANPHGTRGHVFCTGRSDIRLCGVAFHDLGRTTTAPISPANRKARYPLHLHHVYGMKSAKALHPHVAYTIDSCVVNGGNDLHTYKWGIVLHDSHYGHVVGNVLYNIAGGAIVTEGGGESENLIADNFICRVTGTADRMGEGSEATGIWLRGCLNIVSNNVVANVLPGGPGVQHCGYSLWQQYVGSNGLVMVPERAYEEPTKIVDLYETPVRLFADNEVYSSNAGITAWWIGCEYRTPQATSRSYIEGLRTWNIYSAHWINYHTHFLTIRDWVAAGTPLNVSHNCHFYGADYFASDLVLQDCYLEGTNTGIIVSTDTAGIGLIDQCTIVTSETGILIQALWTSSATAVGIPPRHTRIVNTILGQSAGYTRPHHAITMAYNAQRVPASLTRRDRVEVVNHQGVVGINFDVLYREQEPGFVVPPSRFDGTNVLLEASPATGLTNAELWRQHGIAMAGYLPTQPLRTVAAIDGLILDHNPTTDTEPPSTPSIVLVVATSDGVSLQWSASTDNSGKAWYHIARNGHSVHTTQGTVWVDAGLQPDTEYTYSITASDANANESAAAVTTVRTAKLPGPAAPYQAGYVLQHTLSDGTVVHASAYGPSADEVLSDFHASLLAQSPRLGG